jgi:TonB family protein
MSDIKSITLAFPCQQKLTRNAAGEFYCNACAHTIVDFRCQSAEALQAAMWQSSRPVCGIFNRTQLSAQFVRYATATAIVASALANTRCASELHVDEVTIAAVEAPAAFFGMPVETPASPMMQLDRFAALIQQRLRYPKDLDRSGTVYVQFVVDKSGKARDYTVVKGFHPLADQEAVRVMKAIDPLFRPAHQNGVVVETTWVMPVRFTIMK